MESLWKETSVLPSFPSFEGEAQTQALIIGGGLAGILTAYKLKEKGIPCILIEKGRICSGTTGRTTAKLTSQHGLIYHKLIKSLGAEKAKAYLLANEIALKEYFKLCEKIDCDFQIKSNFIYSMSSREKIEKEAAALEQLGHRALIREALPLPFKTAGAVEFENQAQFHPLKFAAEIARELNIYENTCAKEYADNCVITEKGKIKAEHIVVATHFPFINNHGGFSFKLYQHRSYVIALENAPYIDGMYLDEKENGFSFRNYNNLLLIGGGDHRTGKSGGSYHVLRMLAGLCYPRAKEKYHWASQDCMSLDKIPYIGRYSKRTHNLYAASGFCKWGMTGSMVAAITLSDMIAGKSSEISSVFAPSRSVLHPQLFLNGIEAALSLLTPSTRRCPHLQCTLKWNKAEHTWDCSCHGSRFDEKGNVLDGPANGNLKL